VGIRDGNEEPENDESQAGPSNNDGNFDDISDDDDHDDDGADDDDGSSIDRILGFELEDLGQQLRRNNRPWLPHDRQQLRRLKEQGLTDQEIGLQLGRSPGGVAQQWNGGSRNRLRKRAIFLMLDFAYVPFHFPVAPYELRASLG
jgi:DNA-binding CsgD family transcriptional regulator